MLLALFFFARASTHAFGDIIVAYSSVIGPRDNSIERLPHTFLPFCRPASRARSSQSLADSFSGTRLEDIGIHLAFPENSKDQLYCDFQFTADNVTRFTQALTGHYWAQFCIAGLPVWFPLGDFLSQRLYCHQTFRIGYTNNQITDVAVSVGNPIAVSIGATVKFTFSVEWRVISNPDRRSGDRYLFRDGSKFYSAVNSAALVLILFITVVLLLVKLLARDSTQLLQEAAFGDSIDLAEQGWKALHADVFRPPDRLGLLAAVSGCGIQIALASVTFGVIGNLGNAVGLAFGLGAYIIWSSIGGLFATALGRAFGHAKWLRLTLTQTFFCPIVLAIVHFTSALFGGPFAARALIQMSVVLLAVVTPLTIFGGIIALHSGLFAGSKCEVGLVPRSIPSPSFYLRQPCLGLAVGFICTSSVIFEVYYVLSALSRDTGLYVWSHFIAAVVSLVFVAGFLSVLMVYVLLQNEIHRWQWPSFAAPACSGLFVFAYSVYFMVDKTVVHGAYQVVRFLGYGAMVGLAVGLIAGGSGFLFSSVFVIEIFANLKLD
jgi:hypothetical protein